MESWATVFHLLGLEKTKPSNRTHVGYRWPERPTHLQVLLIMGSSLMVAVSSVSWAAATRSARSRWASLETCAHHNVPYRKYTAIMSAAVVGCMLVTSNRKCSSPQSFLRQRLCGCRLLTVTLSSALRVRWWARFRNLKKDNTNTCCTHVRQLDPAHCQNCAAPRK